MRTLGVIPARKGSERFPNKHHARLLGKPMFAYTLEAARSSQRLDRVVVSSDDLTLWDMAQEWEIEFIERPKAMASSTAPLEEALRHACRFLEERDGFSPEAIVVLLGNVPVRKPGQIDEVIEALEKQPQATAVCTAEKLRRRPEWAKRIEKGTSRAIPFMEGHTAYRVQDYPELFAIDGAVQAVRRDVLFAQEDNPAAHVWLGERIHLLVQEHLMYSLEVDYPDQCDLAECYLLRQRCGERWPGCLETLFTPYHGSPALECGQEGESPKGDSPKATRALARGTGFTS